MSVRRRTIAGEDHALIVLQITGRDEHGRPSSAIVGYDDTTFKLSNGDEFVTAWVPAKTLEKRS